MVVMALYGTPNLLLQTDLMKKVYKGYCINYFIIIFAYRNKDKSKTLKNTNIMETQKHKHPKDKLLNDIPFRDIQSPYGMESSPCYY